MFNKKLKQRLSILESRLIETEEYNSRLTKALKGTISRMTEFTRDVAKFHIDCKNAIESLQETAELNNLSIEIINDTLELIVDKFKTSEPILNKIKKDTMLN